MKHLTIITLALALGPFDFRMCFGPKGYCTPVPPPRGVLPPPLT